MALSNKKKILIVDDEKPLARALELKLAKAGFSVKSVTDGEEALQILEKEGFDLILLDLIMPRLDGFGVLLAMKAKNIKTIPIVLTNLSQENDEKRAKEMGAREVLVKSNISLAEIVKKIITILS